jgi:hypothetical protein
MGAELVFLGPSGAGKTTLMRGLADTAEGKYRFTIDRPWTTRDRRPGEDDHEYIFASERRFNAKRPEFLFTMGTYGTDEFGLERLRPLGLNEVRMRVLLPHNALRFRHLLGGLATFCAIVPDVGDAVLTERIRRRDPMADAANVAERIQRLREDAESARSIADVVFENGLGIDRSVAVLHGVLEEYFTNRA